MASRISWFQAELKRRKVTRVAVDPLSVFVYVQFAWNLIGQRRFERSREQLMKALYLALVYMGLGMKTEALDWLEQAYEERDLWMLYVHLDGVYDSLRTEPRFADLLKKVRSEAP
jgi:hypothetical protein